MLRRRTLLGGFLGLLSLLLAAGCGAAHRHGDAEIGSGNRDRHGPTDVENYIARLAADARVLDLDPPSVLAKLALAPNAVVADVGCGPGVFALRFAQAVPQGVVYAVDVEPRQLDEVRAALLAMHLLNVVPVLASHSTPHLPPGSCDVIFIADTYHHIENRVDYFARLATVLRPGGRLAILEYKPGPLPVGPPPEHKLPAGVMAEELAAAGWRRVESFDTHKHHTFEIWQR